MKKFLLACLILLGIGISAQITLGSGTTTSYYPVYPYYGYTYSQQIFPKSEINSNAAGNITGLKFYCASSVVLTNSNDWTVYLGTTTKTSFTSSTDWIPVSSLTQVYTGSVTNNAGVVEITFTTPFSYDNINNLVVAVDENKTGYDAGTSGNFYSYASTSNTSIYYANDATNPDPSAPPTATGRTARKSNVTFVGLNASLLPACPIATAPSNAATGVSVTPAITWGTVTGATGYRLSVGTTSGGTDVVNNLDLGNVTTYTLSTPLLYGKQYYFTLNSYNTNGSSSSCNQTTFTTKNIGCPSVTAPSANASGVALLPTFTWGAVTDATGYRLSIGTTTGGTDVVNNADLGNVTSYTLTTPLSPSTKYYYTINAYTPNNTSASCSERSFTTLCNSTISTFPWTENFDTMSSIGSGVVPTCWASVAGTNSWTSMNASSTTYNAPRSAPNYMTIQYSNTAASQLWTPGFTLTAGTAYEFSFYYNTNGTSSSYIGFSGDVQVNTTPSVTGATSIGTFITSTQGTAAYTKYSVIYTPTATGNYYFALNVSSTSAPWYLGVDDFKLQLAPTCIEPTAVTASNITTATVNIAWTAPASSPGNGYEVYYSTTNTTPTNATTPSATGITGLSTMLQGLSPSTTYYVWVRSNCNANDKSAWSIAGTFMTACSAVTDFNENFDSTTIVSAGNLPGCWSSIGTNSTYARVYASTAVSSPNAMYIYNDGTATGMAATPEISTLQTGNYALKFKARANFTAGGTVEIGYLTNPADTSSFVALGSYTSTSATTVDNYSLDIIGVPAGVNKLVFRHTGGVNAYSILIDDVSYQLKSALATSETKAKDTLKVYPNPFNDVLNISDISKVKSISVTDLVGRLVNTIENPSTALQLGNLKQGMYLVTLNMKDGSKQTIKAIKK
ncbi:fibronectin type III domain-containing protein [Chryseobacterium sp. SIMBA_029]|uniref:fibronectin type III domain-containing protein n=1 Tax=Chryseobacterium sp. SIMBA_029 TaxID=3085772 RepID=UPI003978E0C5